MKIPHDLFEMNLVTYCSVDVYFHVLTLSEETTKTVGGCVETTVAVEAYKFINPLYGELK